MLQKRAMTVNADTTLNIPLHAFTVRELACFKPISSSTNLHVAKL